MKVAVSHFIWNKPTGCSDGLYGPDCKHHCSEHCRDNTVCDHVTGLCGMGCAAGWSGSLCNKGKF